VKAHLIAVQAKMTLEDYESAGRFAGRIDALCARAIAGLDGAPKLIAFPETIGFPLLLTLGCYERVASCTTAYGAARGVLRQSWREVLRALGRGAFGLNALYIARAPAAYRAYHEAFSSAARRYRATIVAGSIFLPQLEEEAAKGLHVVGRYVYNTAYTFSPEGRLLDRTFKSYLMPAEARAQLRGGAPREVHGFCTPLGKVGVAICLDAFYGSVIDRLDGLGVAVVVQPSANHAPWRAAWPANPEETEESAWFKYGLRAQLQERLYLRYGVNPMLVGTVLDLRPRGRSSIVANTRYHYAEHEGYPGLLAVAESGDEEEIIRATVVLPHETPVAAEVS
jgi:predicted amidohydrolase